MYILYLLTYLLNIDSSISYRNGKSDVEASLLQNEGNSIFVIGDFCKQEFSHDGEWLTLECPVTIRENGNQCSC